MDQLKTKNKSYSTFRIVVFTFMVTAMLAVAAWYFLIFEKQIVIVPPVEMTEVKQGNIAVEIVSAGELLPVKTQVVEIPESFFSDYSIQEIRIMSLLPEDSKVEKGDIIAHLDISVYEAVKSKIENEIAEIEKNINEISQDSVRQLKDVKLAFENSRLDLEIRKISVEQSLFDPVSAHERMKLEFSKSTLAYENALANYNERRKGLLEKYAGYPAQLERLSTEEKTKLPALREALKISSPYKGVLAHAERADGHVVMVGSVLSPKNRVVAVVEDFSRLVSQCYLSEDYFSEIGEGQNINIHLKSNAIDIEAKIAKVSRKIETVNGKKVFAIESVVNNPELSLLPGQTTLNKISLNALEDVLYLPNSAVLQEGEKSFVFLSGGVRREIKSKNVNEEFTQVISGLVAGQMVYLDATAAVSK